MNKNYFINYLHARPWRPGVITLCAALLAVAQANLAMADEIQVLPGGEQVMASQAVHTETAGDPVRYAGGSTIIVQSTGNEKLAVRLTTADSSVVEHEMTATARAELKAAGNNPYALAINHDGLIRATGAQIVNGRVFLTARPGVVHVTSDSATIAADTPGLE
jgi:hypothetical protein